MENSENICQISYLLLCYNQERYIKDAVESALSQDYPNMEIIISDDHSTDKTSKIVNECLTNYTGSHKIIFNQNPTNLGLAQNLNTAIALSHGEYFVLAAGDDISFPNRVSLSVKKIKESRKDCLAVNFVYMDEQGRPLNSTGVESNDNITIFTLGDYLNGEMPKSAAFKIVSRKLFDFFGPLNANCPTEDTTLILRALLMGGLAYYQIPCLYYRLHNDSISAKHNLYTRISPFKIYQQYSHDVHFAYTKKNITKKDYHSLLKKIKDYQVTQILIRKLYLEKSKTRRRLVKLRYLLNPHVLQHHRSLRFINSISE